ncbi:MAG TPA: hypothetical protein VFO66_01750 [Gemmatimonadaceae bacterium]|nr:hypothetical protein [Gemmatimonadaceae bacterium]
MSSRLPRLIVILLALAVAALPGALAVADARLEAASLTGAPSHVEALGGTDCAPAHDAECAICSSLRLVGGTTAGAASPAFLDAGSGAMGCHGRTHLVASATWPQQQPRAPPVI